MQFTEEVNWMFLDFFVAGILLLGAALVSEIVWRKVKNIRYRIAIFVALFLVLFLMWVEFAVGIFGTVLGGD